MSVIEKVAGVTGLSDPTKYQPFFPRKRSPDSYWKSKLKRTSFDKMDLAIQAARHMNLTSMTGRFEWETQMKEIVSKIDAWNK